MLFDDILVVFCFYPNGILFWRFCTIFTISILNSLSDRLPVSSSFVWSSEFLPCSFTYCVFLIFSFYLVCCVWCLLALGWRVVVLNCGICPPSWGWTSLKVSWRGDLCLCSVGWSWIMSLWRAVPFRTEGQFSSEFWGVYGFGMTLGSLYANVLHCVPIFSEGLAWGILHRGLLTLNKQN